MHFYIHTAHRRGGGPITPKSEDLNTFVLALANIIAPYQIGNGFDGKDGKVPCPKREGHLDKWTLNSGGEWFLIYDPYQSDKEVVGRWQLHYRYGTDSDKPLFQALRTVIYWNLHLMEKRGHDEVLPDPDPSDAIWNHEMEAA